MCAIKWLSCCLSGSWLACAIAYGRGFDSMKMAYYSSSDTILNCKRHKYEMDRDRDRKRERDERSNVDGEVKRRWFTRVPHSYNVQNRKRHNKQKEALISYSYSCLQNGAKRAVIIVYGMKRVWNIFFSLLMHCETKLKRYTRSVSLSNAVVSLSSAASKPVVARCYRNCCIHICIYWHIYIYL